ncbi:hypothetical protein TEA_026265 [Camellia sinensis var. sinensis]|uniref:Terpene synthase N-terminal domain-containing protein n=1 Tax=Camellia sinensis var. sinensis TaxID=542762 RepID=A0A4S4DGE4_CAMSN|nr:hypothetical protein TEA_026265 [Camellia sinensis var. sinensis]
MQEVDVKIGQQLQQQKEEVRKMLVAANDQLSRKLNFINAIQRLGVSYHFESEIETALQHIYETDYNHHDDKANNDLYTIALLFRLLRQQGHPISSALPQPSKDFRQSFFRNKDLKRLLGLPIDHCKAPLLLNYIPTYKLALSDIPKRSKTPSSASTPSTASSPKPDQAFTSDPIEQPTISTPQLILSSQRQRRCRALVFAAADKTHS